jgi:hypothetical protein
VATVQSGTNAGDRPYFEAAVRSHRLGVRDYRDETLNLRLLILACSLWLRTDADVP